MEPAATPTLKPVRSNEVHPPGGLLSGPGTVISS